VTTTTPAPEPTGAPARPGRRSGGFTLIEVLIALVILAVGLLGLEALGIGATRMVNKARRESQFVAVATSELERVTGRIRGGQSPAGGTVSVPNGTMVTAVAQAGSLWTVTVTVTPATSTKLVSSVPVQLSANVFRPTP
jgi:type IV pilus assembly protein PilV